MGDTSVSTKNTVTGIPAKFWKNSGHLGLSPKTLEKVATCQFSCENELILWKIQLELFADFRSTSTILKLQTRYLN